MVSVGREARAIAGPGKELGACRGEEAASGPWAMGTDWIETRLADLRCKDKVLLATLILYLNFICLNTHQYRSDDGECV